MKDNVNFGLNTDDSGIIGTTLNQEFEVAAHVYQLSLDQLITTVVNSLQSSFLPNDQKTQVMDRLKREIDEFKKTIQ